MADTNSNPYATENYYPEQVVAAQPIVVAGAVVSAQPVVVVVATAVPTHAVNNFSSTLCQCNNDCKSCCIAGCCPCFAFATLKVREGLVGPPSKGFWACVMIFGLLNCTGYADYLVLFELGIPRRIHKLVDIVQLVCTGVLCWFIMQLRREYKKKHGIVEQGGCCSECFVSFFCIPLVLAQMARHSYPSKPNECFYCNPNAVLPEIDPQLRAHPQLPVHTTQQPTQQVGEVIQGKVLV
jgi:Cys-rich protein (TIGR01571 family)